MHTALNIGDSLWLVTRVVVNGRNEYRLVAHLVIRAKTINAPSYKYGSFRVWGDATASSYYRVDESSAHDVFELLRIIEMDSGSLADRNRSNLFQSMQTLRSIPIKSSKLLGSFAAKLPLELRAYQVIDEAELEKAYAVETPDRLELLMAEQPIGYSKETSTGIRQAYDRNRRLVKTLHELYHGRCQVTGHDSPLLYGVPTAEGHHIVYRSRGGADDLDNLVLLCPNLHNAIHLTNATFDYSRLAFMFPNGRVEPLIMNNHLERRAA